MIGNFAPGDWIALAALLTTLGGVGSFFLWLAFESKARRVFATKADLNGVGGKISKVEGEQKSEHEQIDELGDRTLILEQKMESQDARISERVIDPLEKAMDRMDAFDRKQAEQGEALKAIKNSLDRLRDEARS